MGSVAGPFTVIGGIFQQNDRRRNNFEFDWNSAGNDNVIIDVHRFFFVRRNNIWGTVMHGFNGVFPSHPKVALGRIPE